MTDMESIRQQIVTRLPARVRWLLNGTALDFDFSRSGAPLKPVMPADFNSATTIDDNWTSLRIFGEADFAEGGGAHLYLGVHSESGKVLGLDVESEASPMCLLNSDVDRFIQTFLAFGSMLCPRRSLPCEGWRTVEEDRSKCV